MTSPEPIPVDAAEALLARLAGRDVTLAEHIHDCALATEDPHEVAELAKAYRHVARSARQSIALHAQLKRDREAAERAVAAAAPKKPVRRNWVGIARREGELREAIRRIIWDETEAESLDERILLSTLENNLRVTRELPDFVETELDDHVMDVCAALGMPLAKAEHWRDLPVPPDTMGDYDDEYEDTG